MKTFNTDLSRFGKIDLALLSRGKKSILLGGISLLLALIVWFAWQQSVKTSKLSDDKISIDRQLKQPAIKQSADVGNRTGSQTSGSQSRSASNLEKLNRNQAGDFLSVAWTRAFHRLGDLLGADAAVLELDLRAVFEVDNTNIPDGQSLNISLKAEFADDGALRVFLYRCNQANPQVKADVVSVSNANRGNEKFLLVALKIEI